MSKSGKRWKHWKTQDSSGDQTVSAKKIDINVETPVILENNTKVEASVSLKRIDTKATVVSGQLPMQFYQRCDHYGQEVRCGDLVVMAGSARSLIPQDYALASLLVPLSQYGMNLGFGVEYKILAAPLRDFGGVPECWPEFIQKLIEKCRQKEKALVFCEGGHGRTGTVLASLIAVLEPETEDPIRAVRDRYCCEAVETVQQGTAIFALRQKPLPDSYHQTLMNLVRR